MVQVVREHQFERLANLVGHPEWTEEERFATRQGWRANLEGVIRPAVEKWAADKTKGEASATLASNGLAAAPCNAAEDVVDDPHVRDRNMLVELERTDGVAQPVLVAGNPIKMSKMAEGPETDVPSMGQHTIPVLRDLLGLDEATISELVTSGVVA
jgi:formyl-CoA transferase